jgi:hypothetical protein
MQHSDVDWALTMYTHPCATACIYAPRKSLELRTYDILIPISSKQLMQEALSESDKGRFCPLLFTCILSSPLPHANQSIGSGINPSPRQGTPVSFSQNSSQIMEVLGLLLCLVASLL